MQLSTNHYGVKMTVYMDGFPYCCGAKSIFNFAVDGRVSSLTREQKHKMYEDLMRKIIPECPGILIAADCVLNFGEWADLERGSSSWKQSDSAGDISLEDFCEYFGFVRGPVGRNRNSGNLVACFTLATNLALEGDDEVQPLEIKAPDFSDEKVEKKKASADAKAILKELEALLGGS